MDEPRTDKVVKIPEDKQPSPEDLGEPQSEKADDDSLPDPFSPRELKKPKTSETKKTKTKKTHKCKQWTQTCQSSFLAMKKPPHRNSQHRNHCGRSCPTNNYLFLFTFSNNLLPES